MERDPLYFPKALVEFHADNSIHLGYIQSVNLKTLTYSILGVYEGEQVLFSDIPEEKILHRIVETVLCYIEKDNQILMLLRNKKKDDLNEGKWLGIGGHIEYNEDPDDALVREVMEETGITLLDYDKRGILWFINDDFIEVMHLYYSNRYTGFIIPCDEGTLKWQDKDKIFDLNLWDGDRVFLKELFETKDYFEMRLYYKNNEFIRSEKI